MAVSKHNLWKRKKNGLMKLVRSHGEWLQKRRETKTRKKDVPVKDSQWWQQNETVEKSTVKAKPIVSEKRTQVGKKV
tara:strand:+ start:448 stop:678 length:231 start_codon:yes stop_codon:yes gene_type:complete